VVKINAYEKIIKLKNNKLKLITGVTRDVFYKMLKVLQLKYIEEHKRGSRFGLAVELRLSPVRFLALGQVYVKFTKGVKNDYANTITANRKMAAHQCQTA